MADYSESTGIPLSLDQTVSIITPSKTNFKFLPRTFFFTKLLQELIDNANFTYETSQAKPVFFVSPIIVFYFIVDETYVGDADDKLDLVQKCFVVHQAGIFFYKREISEIRCRTIIFWKSIEYQSGWPESRSFFPWPSSELYVTPVEEVGFGKHIRRFIIGDEATLCSKETLQIVLDAHAKFKPASLA
eukprot:snap_masked-scaffold_5-processed-gene-9.26-mRNA-1 protein AED:1.00 eAED:1.00 QI:0/0/0/0/1/1/2/0/187